MEKIRNRHLSDPSMQPAKSFMFPRVFDLWLCSFGHDRKTAVLTPRALAPETVTRRKTRIRWMSVSSRCFIKRTAWQQLSSTPNLQKRLLHSTTTRINNHPGICPLMVHQYGHLRSGTNLKDVKSLGIAKCWYEQRLIDNTHSVFSS